MDYADYSERIMRKNDEIIRLKEKLNYIEESHLNCLIDLQRQVNELQQENEQLGKQNKYIEAYCDKIESENETLIKQLNELKEQQN